MSQVFSTSIFIREYLQLDSLEVLGKLTFVVDTVNIPLIQPAHIFDHFILAYHHQVFLYPEVQAIP